MEKLFVEAQVDITDRMHNTIGEAVGDQRSGNQDSVRIPCRSR